MLQTLCICKDGGNCIKSANVLFSSGAIESKKCSNSSSTSFSFLSCVITLGNFAVNLKFLGVSVNWAFYRT